jgi:hypothetical protein
MSDNNWWDDLVGKTVTEAKVALPHPKYSIRVVKENGQNYIVHADMRVYRIDVAVENGIITEIVNPMSDYWSVDN